MGVAGSDGEKIAPSFCIVMRFASIIVTCPCAKSDKAGTKSIEATINDFMTEFI